MGKTVGAQMNVDLNMEEVEVLPEGNVKDLKDTCLLLGNVDTHLPKILTPFHFFYPPFFDLPHKS